MSSTTVGEQARRLQKTPELLLEQLAYAGVNKTDVNDELTETDQIKLLGYLQRLHGNVSGEPRKIKIVKKSSTEIKPTDSNQRVQTIQVEVRKKRVLIERDEGAPLFENLRIERIQAKAFKAFRDFDFSLQGRNLLVFGGNGAGKSSLYWLLYTFLQSGQKSSREATKYYSTASDDNLLNIHASEEDRREAYISLTLRSSESTLVDYSISAYHHHTKNRPEITKANLASDFITYRTLFNFYNFSNSKTIDLWPVFEKEILPFLNTTNPAQPNLERFWITVQDEYRSVLNARKPDQNKKAVAFDDHVDQFNQYLAESLDGITKEAQKFYDKHFADKDLEKLTLRLGLTQDASQFDRDIPEVTPPKIGFEIQSGVKKLPRPHTFLNEAKLTQLALSVRFGATFVKLQESSFKLLVLDDLLISLDMNNRIPVIDIILGDDFKDYQKIILTHDIGFYKEFRRRIGQSHAEWSFQRLAGNANGQIALIADKSDIEKAQDYLAGHNLDEAAVCLRKAADEAAKRLREYHEGKKLPAGEFHSLTENLKAAKNKLLENIPQQIYQKIIAETEKQILERLVPESSQDLIGTPREIGIAKSKRQLLRNLLLKDGWQAYENIRVINELLESTERVLNPGAHGGEVTLYEDEVSKALVLIAQLERITPK